MASELSPSVKNFLSLTPIFLSLSPAKMKFSLKMKFEADFQLDFFTVRARMDSGLKLSAKIFLSLFICFFFYKKSR